MRCNTRGGKEGGREGGKEGRRLEIFTTMNKKLGKQFDTGEREEGVVERGRGGGHTFSWKLKRAARTSWPLD